MAIKIIKEPDIYMTQAEHDRLQRAWQNACRYTTEPQSFEDFVISQRARSNVCTCPGANVVSSACRMHGYSGLETVLGLCKEPGCGRLLEKHGGCPVHEVSL